MGSHTLVVAGQYGRIAQSGDLGIPTITRFDRLNAQLVSAEVEGEMGQAYSMESSTNFAAWATRLQFTNQQPVHQLTVPTLTNSSREFFRVKLTR